MNLLDIRNYLYTGDTSSIFTTHHLNTIPEISACISVWENLPDNDFIRYVDSYFTGDNSHKNKRIIYSAFLLVHLGNMMELSDITNPKTFTALFNQTNIGGSVSIRECIAKNNEFKTRIYHNAYIANKYLIEKYCNDSSKKKKLVTILSKMILSIESKEYKAGLKKILNCSKIKAPESRNIIVYDSDILSKLLTWLLFMGLLKDQFKNVSNLMLEDFISICEDISYSNSTLPDNKYDANSPYVLFITDSFSRQKKNELNNVISNIGAKNKISVIKCLTHNALKDEWKKISRSNEVNYGLLVCIFGDDNHDTIRSYELVRQFIYYFRDNNIPTVVLVPKQPNFHTRSMSLKSDTKSKDMLIFSEPLCSNEYFKYEEYIYNRQYLSSIFSDLVINYSHKGSKFRTTRDSDNIARIQDPDDLTEKIKRYIPTVAYRVLCQIFDRLEPVIVWETLLRILCIHPHCLKDALIMLNKFMKYDHYIFKEGIIQYAKLEPNEFPLVLSAIWNTDKDQFKKIDSLKLADETNINMINLRNKINSKADYS